MSSYAYKSFALVGAGTLGLPIVQALLERNVPVVVLTRPTAPKSLPDGAKVVTVDYSDVDAIASVLREHSVDVFISTLSLGGLPSQYQMIDAAKAAGVKLFVPSEFGMPSNDVDDETWAGQKHRIATHAKSTGLPTLRLFTGGFQEWVPWMVALHETGKFLIVGKGETYASFTAIPDIAAYLAYILTALPPAQLNDTILRIEGQRATVRDIAALYKGKVPVEFVDSIPGNLPLAEIRNEVYQRFEAGWGSTGWNNVTNQVEPELAGSANKLYPGFKWKSVKETLGL